MISDVLIQSFAVIYAILDILILALLLRRRRQFAFIDLDLLILLKFKSLIDFYVKGQTATFLDSISDAHAGKALSTSDFTERYSKLTKDIANFYEDFSLPYEASNSRREIKSAMTTVVSLALFQIAAVSISVYFNELIYIVVLSLLINTVFWYPLMSQYQKTAEVMSRARDSLSESMFGLK
ncbi:MAG: hypothetical protein QXP70_06450 [Methanomassiliicoccales archaeon]